MIRIATLVGTLALAGTGIALAQTPDTPAAQPPSAASDKPADQTADKGGFATEQTYKTKDGGMYQPPAQRPASPAMNRSVYGRT